MADLTVWAAAWDTFLTKLKTSIAERQASPAGGLERTAILKRDGDWSIGWVEEVPGVNAQERLSQAH